MLSDPVSPCFRYSSQRNQTRRRGLSNPARAWFLVQQATRAYCMTSSTRLLISCAKAVQPAAV